VANKTKAGKVNAERAVELSREGYSLREIAAVCGMSHETARNILNKHGIKPAQTPGRPADEKFHKNVRFFAKQGLSRADIARKLRKTGETFERAYARVHHSMKRDSV
jgi:lambda repressor-like predicted transcriptional regulator